MIEITKKINKSEYDYYLDKYKIECSPGDAELIAGLNKLENFTKIPTRMQYWAASKDFGGTIRNVENHIIAIKNLDKWASYIRKNNPHVFFQPRDEVKESSASAAPIPT